MPHQPEQVGSHFVRATGDLIPGVSNDLEALAPEGNLALAVTLDLRPARMGRSAVELHRKSMLAPEGIDPHAANLAVDFGCRNSGLLAEVEEALLEDAKGLGELGEVAPKGRS